MLRSDITIVIARMFSFRREGGKEGGGEYSFYVYDDDSPRSDRR